MLSRPKLIPGVLLSGFGTEAVTDGLGGRHLKVDAADRGI